MIPSLLESGVIPRIIQLMTHEKSSIAVPCLRMVGNILTGGIIGGAVDLYNNKGLRYPENIDISHSLCK